MTTARKHTKRSRRNHIIYFKSKDRANHPYDEDKLIPTYKNSKNHHKYDGKGNPIQREEESDD